MSQKLAHSDPVTRALTGVTRTIMVGPNQQYTDLHSVPFDTLGAGDIVNVMYRAEPYRTCFLIGGQGTREHPITINGVTDSQGRRPVLDFAGARWAERCVPELSDTIAYGAGLAGLLIMRPRSKPYGYKPSHILVQGCEIRGAEKGASATRGTTTFAWDIGSNVRVQLGTDVQFDNCIVHHGDYCYFVQATDGINGMCSRIAITNGRTYDGGMVNREGEHCIYMQADEPLIAGMHIGKVRSGSNGSSFKDRSARLRLTDSRVLSSARTIDLVHSEDNVDGIQARSYYGKDYVWNNVLECLAPASIHYGGDNMGEQGSEAAEFVPGGGRVYRSHLMMWDNDIQFAPSNWRSVLLALSLRGTRADVWGNRIAVGGSSTYRYMLNMAGQLRERDNVFAGGTVHRSAISRDIEPGNTYDANPANWSISTLAGLPEDEYLQTLIAG